MVLPLLLVEPVFVFVLPESLVLELANVNRAVVTGLFVPLALVQALIVHVCATVNGNV
jgi:hypothetical protein